MDASLSLGKSTAVLFVSDIRRSRVFYEQLLGMHPVADFGLNVIYEEGFATWQVQPENIVSRTLGPEESGPSRSRFELCFEGEQDIEQMYTLLEEAGVRFLHGINEELWGQRTIRFYDPDGHLIEFGETLQVFVRRFRDQGLTPQQVAERTYVPLEMVNRLLQE